MNRHVLLLLALLAPLPALAAEADLLAIPDTLERTLPPGAQMGVPAGPRPGEAEAPKPSTDDIPNYRAEMRAIVTELSAYGHGRNANFALLVRGGADLLTKAPREAAWEQLQDKPPAMPAPVGSLERGYARAVDGIVLDNLYCANGQPVPAEQRAARLAGLRPLTEMGRQVLSIDSCAGDAVKQAAEDKVLQFTAADALLQAIPDRPPHENAALFNSLGQARNLLVNLRSDAYQTKADWLARLKQTNHDVLVIDAFHRGSESLTKAEVEALKYKRLGTRRLVLAAMPLTWASEERFYWKKEWAPGNPAFLGPRIGDSGAYHVDFWKTEWKKILGSHFKGLVDLGFDGVMLDGLDVVQRLEYDNPITEDERKARAQAEKEAKAKAKAAAAAPPPEKKAEPMIGEEVDPRKPGTPSETPPAKAPAKAEKPAAPGKPPEKAGTPAKPPEKPAAPGKPPEKPAAPAKPPEKPAAPAKPDKPPPPPPGAKP